MVNTPFPTVKEPTSHQTRIMVRSPNNDPGSGARKRARHLEIIPLVMRTVAAELRAAGEMPAPAHFGLLSILSTRARSLTELAALQGVSLPSMSTSITAMVDRGWVRRSSPEDDRRVVMIEVTPTGRAALERVRPLCRGAPRRVLTPLDPPSRRRLRGGLGVLRKVFATSAGSASAGRRRNRK
jgi:Transcriptional regulators